MEENSFVWLEKGKESSKVLLGLKRIGYLARDDNLRKDLEEWLDMVL